MLLVILVHFAPLFTYILPDSNFLGVSLLVLKFAFCTRSTKSLLGDLDNLVYEKCMR